MSIAAEYISSERRELSRRFDEVLTRTENTISTLRRTQTLGYSALAKFQTQFNQLFLPNVHNGIINIPNEYRGTETTPLIVVDHNEKYIMGNTFIDHTPSQVCTALKQYPYQGWFDVDEQEHIDAINKQRDTSRNRIAKVKLDAYLYAMTQAALWSASRRKCNNITMQGRPLVIYNHRAEPNTTASTLLHELVHVEQYSGAPFHDKKSYDDILLQNELAAYDQEARFNIALLRTQDPAYTNTLTQEKLKESIAIADLCDLNPVNDRYAPSKVVRRAIKNRGLSHIL